MTPVRRWAVYDGDQLVLELEGRPGLLVSTAARPAGAAPVHHPFISASARSSAHEARLHQALVVSRDVDEFLARLISNGLRVEAT